MTYNWSTSTNIIFIFNQDHIWTLHICTLHLSGNGSLTVWLKSNTGTFPSRFFSHWGLNDDLGFGPCFGDISSERGEAARRPVGPGLQPEGEELAPRHLHPHPQRLVLPQALR